MSSVPNPNVPETAEEDDDSARVAGIVLIVVLTLVLLILLRLGTRLVRGAEVMVIERCGRYHTTLTPGLHWILPIIDRPRSVTWRHVEAMQNASVTQVAITTRDRVDLREHVIDLGKQPVITKDTVQIVIDALVYFRIVDPRNAVYRVQNLPDAIEFLTQSTLRNIMAHTTLDETFSSRETINQELLATVQRDSERWGVEITRVEIFNILPPNDIKDAMERQIKSERLRRSTVLVADGTRESSIIKSRGDAARILNDANGRRAAEIAAARGKAEAAKILGEALAQELQIIQRVVNPLGLRAVDFLSAKSYLNSLAGISSDASSRPTSVVMVPHEAVDYIETFVRGPERSGL